MLTCRLFDLAVSGLLTLELPDGLLLGCRLATGLVHKDVQFLDCVPDFIWRESVDEVVNRV